MLMKQEMSELNRGSRLNEVGIVSGILRGVF